VDRDSAGVFAGVTCIVEDVLMGLEVDDHIERAKAIAREGKAKLLKSDHRVRYREQPSGKERCGVCTMYIEPRECSAVMGRIQPRGWCKLFKGRE
jgi:hypothetical protein